MSGLVKYPTEFPASEVWRAVQLLRQGVGTQWPEVAHVGWCLQGFALSKLVGEPEGVLFGEALVLDGEAVESLSALRRAAEQALEGAAAEVSEPLRCEGAWGALVIWEVAQLVLRLLRKTLKQNGGALAG